MRIIIFLFLKLSAAKWKLKLSGRTNFTREPWKAEKITVYDKLNLIKSDLNCKCFIAYAVNWKLNSEINLYYTLAKKLPDDSTSASSFLLRRIENFSRIAETHFALAVNSVRSSSRSPINVVGVFNRWPFFERIVVLLLDSDRFKKQPSLREGASVVK